MVWREGKVPAVWRDGIITPLARERVPRRTAATTAQLHCCRCLEKSSRMCSMCAYQAPATDKPQTIAVELHDKAHYRWCHHSSPASRRDSPGIRAPLNVVYIDLKAAFDSVDRAALWKSLEGIGTPTIIKDLITTCTPIPHHPLVSVTCFPRSSQLPLGCARAVCLLPSSSAVRSTGWCGEFEWQPWNRFGAEHVRQPTLCWWWRFALPW